MKAIYTASFSFGNFAITGSLPKENVTDEQIEAGITQILQRSPASEAERTLSNYDKRPKGFQRTSIPYAPESAEVIKAIFESAMPGLKVEVTHHEGGGTPTLKAALSQIKSRANDPIALGNIAEKVGFEFNDESELTVDNAKFVAAVVKYISF